MTTMCKHKVLGDLRHVTVPPRLTPHRTIRCRKSDIQLYRVLLFTRNLYSFVVLVRILCTVTIRLTTGSCFFAIDKVVNFSPDTIFSSSHDILWTRVCSYAKRCPALVYC